VIVVDDEESVTLQPTVVSHSLKLQVVHVVAGLKMLLVVVVMHVEAVFFLLQVSLGSPHPPPPPPPESSDWLEQSGPTQMPSTQSLPVQEWRLQCGPLPESRSQHPLHRLLNRYMVLTCTTATIAVASLATGADTVVSLASVGTRIAVGPVTPMAAAPRPDADAVSAART